MQRRLCCCWRPPSTWLQPSPSGAEAAIQPRRILPQGWWPGLPRPWLRLLPLLAAAGLLILVQGRGGGCPGPCFAVYYGPPSGSAVEWLAGFELAIVAPTLPGGVVERLSAGGTLLLAYMSASTIGGWEPWAANVTGDMLLNDTTAWGERVANPCSPAWRRLLADAAAALAERGYAGVMLDNLDMVDRYPWMRRCLAQLVEEVREALGPEGLLAVNRGFTLLGDVWIAVDYVLFEGFATGYAPGRGVIVYSGGDLEWMLEQLQRLRRLQEAGGPRVLLLAYTDTSWSHLDYICSLWREHASWAPLYVAPGPLQGEGRCNPCSPCRGGG